MRIFFDTEFCEKPNTIELISIGMVNERDETLYNISSEFNPTKCNEWVKNNVLPKIKDEQKYSIEQIRANIIDFIGESAIDIMLRPPEFWADYCNYDWVVFCWIFGDMNALPKNFPMYCNDLQQLKTFIFKHKKGTLKGCPKQDWEKEHNALDDAIHVKECYEFLMTNNKEIFLFHV